MKPLLPLLFLVLAACPDGRPADEGPHCEETATDIPLDEATSLGFTAAEALAHVPASESAALVYADGTTAALSLGFAAGSTARFVDSEAVYPEGGMSTDIGVICEDRLEIDGTFTFASDDGAFAESFAIPVSATVEGVSLRQELDLDGLAGTFDLVPFVDAEDYDALSAWIEVRFVDGVSAGTIAGQASGEDECAEGDACTAWAESVPVGSWGMAVEE